MSDLLNQASLVMVPSGYKEDTVYSVVPTDGSGDLSFTRASNGTRVNSAGLVEVCPWNLLEYSEDFSNAVWVKQNAIAVTANTTTAPNGTTTADTLEKASGSGGVNYYYIVTSTNSFEQLTNFFYVKHKSGSGIVWLLGKNTGTFAFFDVINGTALSKSSGMTTSVESVGNGWYKCIFSQSYVGATSTEFGIGLCLVDGTPNYDATSAATQSVYIWGAQSAVGTTAKPYFPTTDRLNVPRLTYQNGGGGCPSLLLEKQSTNYFPYSQNVAQWYEPDDGITLSQNTTDTTSPDGTNNAAKITIVGGNQRNYQITNSVAGTGTFSAYVKAGTSSTLALYTSSASLLIGYNLSTLAVTQTTGTGTITSVGNGWYRITATNTLGASEVLQVLYTGNANETIYIWGFQCEASSYATSYIPTTSSSATRVADECSKTGISSLIGQTEGVVFFEGTIESIGTTNRRIISLSDGTNANTLVVLNLLGTLDLQFAVVDSSVTQASITASNAFTLNQIFKFAFAYANNDFAFYVNGVQIGVDNSGTVPASLANLVFGRGPLDFLFEGKVNQAALFKTRLTNAELASLTTI